MQIGDYVVHIVDDEEPVRKSLAFLLTLAGFAVRVHESATSFLAAAPGMSKGCLVTDLRMPDMSGVELLTKLGAANAMMPAIVITGHGDVPMAVEAMQAGAFDFLQKPFRDQDLIDCINRALKADTENRAALEKHADIKRRFESLTPREMEVMEMLVDGRANKVIAIDLGLSERTVEIHRANVMEKMGVRSVAHLVRMKLALGNG